MNKCDNCGKEVETLNEIGLYGEDDFYKLDVCEECDEYLTGDYFPPEQITEMFRC